MNKEMKSSVKTFATILFFLLILNLDNVAVSNSKRAKSIYVLSDSTGIITEYDALTFNVKQIIQIPKDLYFTSKDLFDRPWYLRISNNGHILYYNDERKYNSELTIRNIWYFDGEREYRALMPKVLKVYPSLDYSLVLEKISAPVLDSELPMFYWIINRIAKYRNESVEKGYYKSFLNVNVELLKIHFDANKLVEEPISITNFEECECETGICEETCPFGYLVEPKGGISNFLEIEHRVCGQLETRVEGYTYFEKINGNWIKTNGEGKFKQPFIEVYEDGGCCGWINASSDMLFVTDGKIKKVIFNEWDRFSNKNYDVSFVPNNGELSPDFSMIAYEIIVEEYVINEYKNTGTIRLSCDGVENKEELNRIISILQDLPIAEIVSIQNENKKILELKNTRFIGWINNNKLLLQKDTAIYTYDISNIDFVSLSLSVKPNEYVFLR